MPGLAREAVSQSVAVRSRSAWNVALLAGAASLGLLTVGPGVLILLGGEEYAAAGPVIRLLAVAVVPLFANVLLSHALIAAGRPERLPRLTALRVGIALALAVGLTPRFGPLGAAAGFVLSESIVLIFGIRACRAVRFPVPILVPFGAGIGLAVPMAVVVAWTGGHVAPRIAVGVAIWVATIGVAWYLRQWRSGARSASRSGPG